jgi:hypothetical protein
LADDQNIVIERCHNLALRRLTRCLVRLFIKHAIYKPADRPTNKRINIFNLREIGQRVKIFLPFEAASQIQR